MTEELKKEAREYLAEHSKYSEVFGQTFVAVDTLTAMVDFAEPREKRIADLEAQIEKTKSLNKEIIKALNECLDYEWLLAHNGKAKYLYLQTVIDIVNEKFKEIKENE